MSEIRTPENIYNPACARCRDEAGKDRAGAPDQDLCGWHARAETERLRAEVARLRSEKHDGQHCTTERPCCVCEARIEAEARAEKAERENAEAREALADAGTLMGQTIGMSYCESTELPEKDHTHALPAAMLRVIRRCGAAESALAAEREAHEETKRRVREWAATLGWLGSPQDERVEAEVLALVAQKENDRV